MQPRKCSALYSLSKSPPPLHFLMPLGCPFQPFKRLRVDNRAQLVSNKLKLVTLDENTNVCNSSGTRRLDDDSFNPASPATADPSHPRKRRAKDRGFPPAR
ncbi:hypothetical protein MIND_00993700 [Mycena indigotica]|uniref:Uncharacterized protein n=1 Tax=Mycena indigotica TaxID=2126181 RepID=A0A8H6VUN0_9AGAR|nr:uncharacterized protein MIND_00993700 [Mycena indigotica]KAF7294572.1 hypothetical protein MIND_00993700 [Mycena indigotica]